MPPKVSTSSGSLDIFLWHTRVTLGVTEVIGAKAIGLSIVFLEVILELQNVFSDDQCSLRGLNYRRNFPKMNS